MFKEVRRASYDGLYNLAVKEWWFTKANNEVYKDWLDYSIHNNLAVEQLEAMAEEVMQYSNLADGMEIESIMFLIEREACYHIFEKI